MVIKHYLILSLSLIMSFSASSADIESTNDYAYGAKLELSDNRVMFSRVELNQSVYTQTLSPTLDDIRVFNRNGRSVPFALVNVDDNLPTKQEMEMLIYEINQDKLTTEDGEKQNNYSLSIQGQNVNLSIDKPTDKRDKYIATYLLQIPEDKKISNPIINIHLSFTEQTDNWQAVANVSNSTNLKYWNNVSNNISIMSLKSNDNHVLTSTDIQFQTNNFYQQNNWLITLYSQNPIPKLLNATATLSAQTSFTLYPIPFSLVSSDDQSAIYQVTTSIPVKELSIKLLTARSVLPVSIYYKTTNNDKNWRKLDDYIIKTGIYDEPTQITLNNRLINQIKLVPINSSIENPPEIKAFRHKVDLVFNSANNAPFILAWGSSNAKAAKLKISDLLPNEDISQLPLAYISDSVKLAGSTALEATTESKSFPNWVIWIGLMAGVGLLTLLAYQLLKEMKKQ